MALLGACALALGVATAASGAPSRSSYRVQRLCGSPRPGAAACLGMKLLAASLTPADLHADATRQAKEAAAGERPAVTYESPFPGYLTPQSLHEAYALPTETTASSTQTIAVVDAYDDPTAEADLGVFDAQFGLPPCTSANGCFRKINENGQTSPLPPEEGGWAGEISIDVQMAHAICQNCHVLLVEANTEEFSDLGAAVNAAANAGATEISNSYAGPEQSSYSAYNASYYDHPGVVLTAASGDCGYLNKTCRWLAAANFPADSQDVVAVGGTKLVLASQETWKSTVWKEGGSGCSAVFAAPLWQSAVANFSATGCGGGRSVADVAAIADPSTGVDVYDSTPEVSGAPTGWGVWGGTSVASPIVAAEFALAGGSHGVDYPAATLYPHIGDAGALYDVVSGSNGSCGGATSCQAVVGYDGPTGVGSPIGLSAFAAGEVPASISRPVVSGIAEKGQVLSLTRGEWSNNPTSISDQWERCNTSGESCAAIAGATGEAYTLAAVDIGSTIRVQETARNASGFGPPAVSTPTATVVSNVPKIGAITPAAGITGSSVTINGTALGGASKVRFGPLAASFTVLSNTQVEATVPNGARAGKISVSTPVGVAKSAGSFTPTLSVTGFSPSSGPPGELVAIKGIGFTPSSTVSFDGVPATGVSYVSAKKLTAVVPAGAGTGAVTVTNTAAPAGQVSSASSYTPT